MAPPGSLPWPPAPASAAITPLTHRRHATSATLSPVVQASNHIDLSSLHDPLPDSTPPVVLDNSLATQAPPLVAEAPNSRVDSLDNMSPSLGLASHAETPGEFPVVPEGSFLDNGSAGNLSQAVEGNPAIKPAGSGLYLTGAPERSTGRTTGRNAKVAPVRLFSKAAIYPYGSQGLSCQGADSTVLSSTGGPTYCLDVNGFSTSDGAPVWPP
jgi:hypothetical protein